MIRAVVFDLGGVLEVVDDDRWQQQWVSRWEECAGVTPGTVARFSAGLPPVKTEHELRERLVVALALSDNDGDRAMKEFWDSYCGDLDIILRDFVSELKKSVAVAALSNSADGARREDDRRYRFSELFDLMVYSHELGLEKPDAAIYRHTQEALGVQAHEIVFLDDRPAAVEGAQSVGWHAVHHLSTTASIASIRSIIASERSTA